MTLYNLYVLKFDTPLGNERHSASYYVGITRNSILDRLAQHKRGAGAAITRAANERGIKYDVIYQLEGVDREIERRIKRMHNTARWLKKQGVAI